MTAEQEVSAPEWPDWEIVLDWPDERGTKQALRNLACYANPDLVSRLGLGLGGHALAAGTAGEHSGIKAVWQLANRLAGLRVGWTVQPFNPRGHSRQIIRTTEELIEGEGTCLDFAVSLAALCMRERIPVALAVARPDQPHAVAHAFVIVERLLGPADRSAGPGTGSTYGVHRFHDWVSAFRHGSGGAEHHLVDVTPLTPDDPDNRTDAASSAQHRSRRTLDKLARQDGWVYTVAVEPAVNEAGYYYRLPRHRRDLGITTWLPDLPVDFRNFPSHSRLAEELAHSGQPNVLLVGPRGSGKSTLALAHAQEASSGRGWFLDGSDRRTLLRSLADAEEQSRGGRVENEQPEYLAAMSVRARRRLASTSQPWVVVIDNADGPPDQILDLLPVPKSGQRLIVTSTNEHWKQALDADSWAVIRVGPLDDADLTEPERDLGLRASEFFPGLLRIARSCDPAALRAATAGEPGTERIVRAALGWASPAPAPMTDLALLAASASFMPAERIAVGWLAEAAFDGDRSKARRLVSDAAALGLVEHSRQSLGARDHDEMPLWMHRAIGGALRQLAASADPAAGLRVVASDRVRHAGYAAAELDSLCSFLATVPADQRTHLFAQAAVPVMDLLESRGSEAVKRAASLGKLALPCVDLTATDAVRLQCVILMARAREVNQDKTADVPRVNEAIAWCATAENSTAAAAKVAGDAAARAYDLLNGRAQAMHGILIRKLADRLPADASDPSRGELLERAIAILTKSYLARRRALTVNEKLTDDPDHHVDRGWFNLGGANIALGNYLVRADPARLPAVLTDALKAYAGSLALRRDLSSDPDTMYTAASLWGVALALYSAAIYCPGQLSLDDVSSVEELDPLRRAQTMDSTLRAAELTCTRSLDIRATIDGPAGRDTEKSRDLLLKISLAWRARSQDPGMCRTELLAALTPFTKDAAIEPLR